MVDGRFAETLALLTEVGDRHGGRKSVCFMDVKEGAEVDPDEFTELVVLEEGIGGEVEAREQLGEHDVVCR